MTAVWRRWLPAVVVPVVIAVGAVAIPLQAGAAVDLPDKTAQQVLELVGQSTVKTLSGTIEQTSNLGLPQLDGVGPAKAAGGLSVTELLTGSHAARVFLDGSSKARVQIMDWIAERDAIRQGNDLWLYNSADNSATHLTLPDNAGTGFMHGDVTETVPTPAEVAQQFLAAIDPTTTVTVGRDTVVAGRSTYELILEPRTEGTLVASVSIAVDSETGLPLSVSVYARGQNEPAFSVAFTQLTFNTPDAALFEFTAPAGATVTEQAVPAPGSLPGTAPEAGVNAAESPAAIVGTGWDAVVVVPAESVPTELTASPLLTQVATNVAGGTLLHTTLVNALLTDDGRLLLGSVPLSRLQSVADGQ